MASVPITIKVDPATKQKIDRMIAEGKYRHISDFMHRAIKAEIDREGVDPETYLREKVFEALKSDPEVREVLRAEIRATKKELFGE